MKFKKRIAILAVGVLLGFSMLTSKAYAAEYKVIPNDSLFKIGQLFQTTVNTLKADNQLTSDLIFPGQILRVPATVHSVKSGDTLFLIARHYNISLSNLRLANSKWDDLLFPGQRLIIPGVKPTGQTATPTVGQNTVISFTQEEFNLLARLITAEAGGEPYEAMVAVGGVVVNRVKSSDWPSSIHSVIYQVIGEHHQFTPVKNGFINNPPSDAAIRASWAALYGSDPSLGAIFYFDISSTNQWMWSRPITARIGKMIYAK